MNLTLARFRDLSILVASGPVSAENFVVLQAGIRKLFREGKNKIILELPDAYNFPPEVLRQLAHLNLIAAELSGQIVLSRIEPLVRMKIDAFAKPAVVRCFRTREEALLHFHPEAREELEVMTPSPAPGVATAAATPAAPASEGSAHLPGSGETAPRPTAVPMEAQAASRDLGTAGPVSGSASKDQIRNAEIGDLGTARARIVTLENENANLRLMLEKLVLKRREAPDLPAAEEKIQVLTKQVDDLVTQLNNVAKK